MRPASLTAAAPPSSCQETHSVATVEIKTSSRKGAPTSINLAPRLQCLTCAIWRCLLRVCRSGDALENSCNALAATNAHGDQCVAAADALQLVQGLDSDQGTSRANRVAQRNAGTIRVDLGRVQTQIATDCAGLRSKGFIGFNHVQIVHGQTRLFQGHLTGRYRADAHVFGVHASMC